MFFRNLFSTYTNRRAGFTLMELLVVIAIVGILATVVLASLNSSRTKSQNAAILSQMYEYQKALELIYSQTGAYPVGVSGNQNFENRVACLGDGVGTLDCLDNVSYSQGGVTNIAWNDTVETALRQYLSALPRFELRGYSSPGYHRCASAGPTDYNWNSPQNQCGANYYSLWFLLDGANQNCGKARRVDATFGSTNDLTLCRLQK